jgi:hypothetical protein
VARSHVSDLSTVTIAKRLLYGTLSRTGIDDNLSKPGRSSWLSHRTRALGVSSASSACPKGSQAGPACHQYWLAAATNSLTGRIRPAPDRISFLCLCEAQPAWFEVLQCLRAGIARPSNMKKRRPPNAPFSSLPCNCGSSCS